MKFRTVKYLSKEGCKSIFKHKMMSVATLTTVIASFIVFGLFICLLLNVNYMVKGANEEPQLSVICELKLSDAEIKKIEDTIAKMPEVAKIDTVSVDESFDVLLHTYFAGEDDENIDLLKSLDKDEFLAVKISVNLKDATTNQDVIKKIKKISGVNKVKMPQEIVNFIIKASKYVKVASIALLILFIIIAILIISNAIKLTVVARKTQITIMKYVGATNAFVRLPFVIEGVVIGMIGSLVAYGLILYAYASLVAQIPAGDFGIAVYGLGDVVFGGINFSMLLLIIFVVSGALIGAIGSAYSMKKYLKY